MNIKLFNDNCITVLQSDEFKALIDGKNVVVVTDPPFNIGYHYKTYNDRMKETEYLNMLKQIFVYPFVVIHYPEEIYKIAQTVNKVPKRVVSWVYNSNTARQHRDIAFFDIEPIFTQVIQPYKNPTDKRIKARIERGLRGGAVIRLVECEPG